MNQIELGKQTESTISERLADYACAFTGEQVPEQIRRRAHLLILDALGIGFASHGYDFSDKVVAAIRALDAGGPRKVIGLESGFDLRNAVFLNGTLIHGLDFDDTHARGVIHATASILPTVLGVAAHAGRSASDMVSAYILGMEIGTRLGAVARGGFHQVGFHPTGLIGAFACTVAAGWLMGLSRQQMVDAQGLVLSMGSGTLEFLNDGAWNKRMHPGWAGVAGITAATLGQHAYTGTRQAYEGRFGLYESHLGAGSDYDLSLATAQLGQVWETGNVSVKPLAACHFTHASIDAALRLHAQGVGGRNIKRVLVRVPQEVVKTVCEPQAAKRQPANSYEAQFSIPYLVSTALLKGRFTLEELEEASLRDPQILALAARVDYECDPDSGFPRCYSGEVVVELEDGSVLREREAINRGSIDRPLSATDIVDKFRSNASRQLGAQAVAELEKQVLDIESYSAREVESWLGRDINTLN